MEGQLSKSNDDPTYDVDTKEIDKEFYYSTYANLKLRLNSNSNSNLTPTPHSFYLPPTIFLGWLINMSVEVITTISPNTNEAIITRNGLSAEELDLLPKTANEAFKSWSKTSLADRQAIVKKALRWLTDHTDELALEITTQMGRPIAYSAKEVATAIKRCEYLLKISEETLKDTDGEPEKGFKRFIRKVPVGPVLVLFPWNVSSPWACHSFYSLDKRDLMADMIISTHISRLSTHSSPPCCAETPSFSSPLHKRPPLPSR